MGQPVALTIKDGRVTDIQGGTEADQVRWFLRNLWRRKFVALRRRNGARLEQLCQPDAASVRSWKKHYGAMHFGIGHGADRGKIFSVLRLEGITEKITMLLTTPWSAITARFWFEWELS